MKYADKAAFEEANVFGTGSANTAYARYFVGDSFLNPLTDPKGGLFAANVTFAPGCREQPAVDFTISEDDMAALRTLSPLESYGAFDVFPVFSGKPLA